MFPLCEECQDAGRAYSLVFKSGHGGWPPSVGRTKDRRHECVCVCVCSVFEVGQIALTSLFRRAAGIESSLKQPLPPPTVMRLSSIEAQIAAPSSPTSHPTSHPTPQASPFGLWP